MRIKLLKQLSPLVLVILACTVFSFSQQTSEFDKGKELLKQEKWQEAILFLQKSLEINPTNSAAHWLLAIAYTKTNNATDAISALEKVLTLEPNQGDDYYAYLGFNYYELAQYEKAARAYRKAIQLKPENESYKKSLNIAENAGEYTVVYKQGMEYYTAQDFKKSAKAFERAAELLPNAAVFSNLGKAYYQSKQYTKAMASYREVLRLEPNYPGAKEDLAVIEAAKKEQTAKRNAVLLGLVGAVARTVAEDKDKSQEHQTQNEAAQIDNGGGTQGNIVGSWLYTGIINADGSVNQMRNRQSSLEVGADGRYNQNIWSGNSLQGHNGTYVVNGNRLTIAWDGQREVYTITFGADGILTLREDSGSGWTLERAR